MEYLNALAPAALIKTALNAGSEVTRRVWAPSPPPQRPFRVCDHKRNTRKGLTAGTLKELLVKLQLLGDSNRFCRPGTAEQLSVARETLLVSGLISLVLEEDGTLVDTEEFFGVLEDNTSLMVLGKNQKWSHAKGVSRLHTLSREKPRNSRDIARITFDIYKLNPRDLFGSLNISATFYGLYSMSCDFKCLGPKKVLREFLRVASAVMHGLGNILLGTSHYIRRLVDGGENWHQHARLTSYED